MAKSLHNNVLDAALDFLKDNGNRLCICSAQPTTYAEAITTYNLGYIGIDSADYAGPVDGDVSGRKIVVNTQSGIPITVSGSATHLAIVNTNNSTLLAVSLISSRSVVIGEEVETPNFDLELRDPK